MNICYASYRETSIEYNMDNHSFKFSWYKMNNFLQNGKITGIQVGDKVISLNMYKKVTSKVMKVDNGKEVNINYSEGPKEIKQLPVHFIIKNDYIQVLVKCRQDAEIIIEGDILWGNDIENSTFAVALNKHEGDIRTGVGPAASRIDNALFDRVTDRTVEFVEAENIRLKFDWEKKTYRIKVKTGISSLHNEFGIRLHDNYFSRKFGINYKPMNPNFCKPPVGWMTWYAIQFKASEQTIINNTKWMADNLKNYGANFIWVDWEWYHSDMSGTEEQGVDIFNPNSRYPNGMKYLSDKIKEYGFIPAIWIAINDVNQNIFLKNNPECVISNDVMWCGNCWVDPTHPKVIQDYIPKIFKMLLEWGYDAFKWDCIYHEIEICDKYHDRFYDQSVITAQALRNIIRIARDIIGENSYFLGLMGELDLCTDYFDSARIGGDVFSWDDFIKNSVINLMKYYCYNNIIIHTDLDNVILREEFNNMEQAKSRAVFVSLTGTPFTMGDDLLTLPKERVNIIKKCIPVLSTHPMDLQRHTGEPDVMIVNMFVEKPFESWNVIDVFNTSTEERNIRIDLLADLHIDKETEDKYIVYDFWAQNVVGMFSSTVSVKLKPYESKVLSVRKRKDKPQIVSTSRHITQGAYDIIDTRWDNDYQALYGVSKMIENDKYIITVYSPDKYTPKTVKTNSDYRIIKKEEEFYEICINPENTGEIEWTILFEKEVYL